MLPMAVPSHGFHEVIVSSHNLSEEIEPDYNLAVGEVKQIFDVFLTRRSRILNGCVEWEQIIQMADVVNFLDRILEVVGTNEYISNKLWTTIWKHPGGVRDKFIGYVWQVVNNEYVVSGSLLL